MQSADDSPPSGTDSAPFLLIGEHQGFTNNGLMIAASCSGDHRAMQPVAGYKKHVARHKMLGRTEAMPEIHFAAVDHQQAMRVVHMRGGALA